MRGLFRWIFAVTFLGSTSANAEEPSCEISGSVAGFTLVEGEGGGLTDEEPAVPTDGNPCTTVGGQRIFAVKSAFALIGVDLNIIIPVAVAVAFEELPPRVLGSASTTGLGLKDGALYPVALLNQLLERDWGDSVSLTLDINVRLTNDDSTWDYGVTGEQQRSPYRFNLLTVLVHELGHGLGVASQTAVDEETQTATFRGAPSIYDTLVEDRGRETAWAEMDEETLFDSIVGDDVWWTGNVLNAAAAAIPLTGGFEDGRVRIYAPTTYSGGSSASHVDVRVTPSEMMEPSYVSARADAGALIAMLKDLGWIAPSCGNGVVDDGEACDGTPCCSASCTIEAEGTACGESPTGDCDLQDSCDAEGICQDHVAEVDTTCGGEPEGDCDLQDRCDDGGVCVSVTLEVGTACGETPTGECDLQDTCNAEGVCEALFVDADSSCGPAVVGDCDLPDICDGAGRCVSKIRPETTECGGPPEGPCDLQDTCDAAGTCLENKATLGAECGGEPVGPCDLQNTCDGTGQCQERRTASGVACGSAPIGPCDVQDMCDGAGRCLALLAEEGTVCGDLTAGICEAPDLCDARGQCIPHVAAAGEPCGSSPVGPCDLQDECDGLGACVEKTIEDGAPCADALFCNGEERCLAGVCVAAALPCAPADGCLEHVCDEAQGCISAPIVGCCTTQDDCQANHNLGDSCTAVRCLEARCVVEYVDDCCHEAYECPLEECSDDSHCAAPPGVCAAAACIDGLCDVTYSSGCCEMDAHCDDGNACSLDRCVEGRCETESSPLCPVAPVEDRFVAVVDDESVGAPRGASEEPGGSPLACVCAEVASFPGPGAFTAGCLVFAWVRRRRGHRRCD